MMVLTTRERPAAVEPLVAVLWHLSDLLDDLSNDLYTVKPGGAVTSSIGGHVRHNLDHLAALLRGLDTGIIDYDDRQRGTPIESDLDAARDALQQLRQELLDYPWQNVPESLTLKMLVSPDSPPVIAKTSLERELGFVLSHTIHHNAILAMMAKLLGVTVPQDFGYAPSTLAHQRSRTCVR